MISTRELLTIGVLIADSGRYQIIQSHDRTMLIVVDLADTVPAIDLTELAMPRHEINAEMLTRLRAFTPHRASTRRAGGQRHPPVVPQLRRTGDATDPRSYRGSVGDTPPRGTSARWASTAHRRSQHRL